MASVKILLVEDESVEAMDIKSTLESFDYEVPYVASNGEEAINKASEIKPDIILMDIVLKDKTNGIDAAYKIKNLDIPVIFLTAHTEKSIVQKAKITEPFGYLLKPYNPKELKLTIEMALSYHEMGQKSKEIILRSPIPQFFIDNNHRVVFWNKALEKYSGIKAEEVVGTDQHWKAFYSEKRPCMADLVVDNALEKLQEFYPEYNESELTDGAYEATDFFPNLGEGGKWLYFTATAIKDSNGDIVGALETLEDVTDRIMAEKALKKSEERFRVLAHSAIDGIITTNLNGNIILLNESLKNIFGYNKNELVGESVTMLMPERYRANFQNKLDKFKETGEHELAGKTFETTGVRKDGTEFPFEMSLSTWKANGEKFTSSIIRDITKRKKLESELKESQERFKIVADFTYDWEYWIGPDGNLIYVSPSSERISGYSPEEFINDPELMEKIIHPKDFAFIKHLLEESTSEKYTDIIRYRLINKQGDEKWISHGCQPVYNDKGRFIGRRASNRDITDRKKAEISLQKSEERFRAVAESAIDAIVTTDVDGKIIFFNNSLKIIFGYSKEELTSKPLTILMPERFKNNYLNELEKFKESGQHRLIGKTVVTTGLRKDGTEFPFEMSLSSWKSGDKIYFTSIIRDLTEKKVAEEALRESEKNYRELVDNSMVGIYKTNLEGDIIFANDAMVEMFDFESVKALKTKKATHLYKNPKDRKNLIEKLQKDGMYNYQEVDMISNDGKTITILLSAFLEGNIISGMMIDISERKKSEKDLEISENRYRTIFENSGTAILTINDDGSIIMVNSEWEYLSGYSREEVEGKMKWMEFIHPDYLEKLMKLYNQRMKVPYKAPQKYETVFIKKSGEQLVVYSNVTPLPGTDNWLVSALDITDLKNTQKKLEKSVLRFRALAEYALDGIITTDAHGKILYFNNSLLKMFGYTQNELINSQLTKLMPRKYRDNFMDGLRRFRSTGEHRLVGRTIETTGLKKDGDEFPFEMSLTKWEADEKIYFTSIIRDISERKKAEDDLRESLKEKEVLLREIHHRVKNNMQIISGLLNLQIKHVEEEEAVNVLIESQGRVKSMAMIHENLYRSDNLNDINFKKYVKDLINDIFYSYGIKKGTIEPELEIEDIRIDIDTAIPLGLIINELVTNSVKYAFPQGKGTIKIKLNFSQDKLELTIADNGVGIPHNLDYKNTDSLGLQLVNGLVGQIDGEIVFDGSHGTQFKIIFKELE